MYEIDRIRTNGFGTFGVLSVNGNPVCVTLEETWLNNSPNISCIPEGVYSVKSYSGTKYKNVWMVYDVPGRSSILIHWGNTERDTEGCILVGKYYAKFDNVHGVADSKNTVNMLRSLLPKEFILTIRNKFM